MGGRHGAESASYDEYRVIILKGITKEYYRKFISDIAFAIFCENKEIISFEIVSTYVNDFFEIIKKLNKEIPKSLQEILPTFYFKESDNINEGAIEFVHKSFREYMTAEKLWNDISRFPFSQTTIDKALSMQFISEEISVYLNEFHKMAPDDIKICVAEFLKQYLYAKLLVDGIILNNNINSVSKLFFNITLLLHITGTYSKITLNNQQMQTLVFLANIFAVMHPSFKISIYGLGINKDQLNVDDDNITLKIKMNQSQKKIEFLWRADSNDM